MKNHKPGTPGKSPDSPLDISIPPAVPEDSTRFFPIVGIGASAGGLEAFSELLRALPAKTGMAFVYIQHLDPNHPSLLTDLLARETTMPVREATDNTVVEPDTVYVIVPNTVLTISHGILHAMQRGQTGRFLPVNEFLNSLAGERENLGIGVILSGTASDGTTGIQSLNKAGGITIAQAIGSATQSGMPQSAIDTGAVDFVLDPTEIAGELARIGQNPYLIQAAKREADERLKVDEKAMDDIFSLLVNSAGVDFSQYKQSTIKRRIMRRMVLHKFGTLEEYATYLDEHPEEIALLAEEMVIHVTSFFREPEVFAILRSEIFPLFFQGRAKGAAIRVWVPGCSTGEEAYSILISLHESMEEHEVSFPIQMFASDISEPAVNKARDGIYPGAEVRELSGQRKARFFDDLGGEYRVKKELRESIIFASHDLTRDPPFSHLDFISCRNLLIYLDIPMQRQVIPVFHYALNPEGVLLLGISETTGPFTDLFSTIDPKFRIYRKKPAPNRIPLALPLAKKAAPGLPSRRKMPDFTLQGFDPSADAFRILGNYGPPAIFVNESLDILWFSGKIGPYLEPVHGEAGLTLNKMIHRDLLVDLRTVIHKVRESEKPDRKENVRIGTGEDSRTVSFTVEPVHSPNKPELWYYLIIIDRETGPAGDAGGQPEFSRPGESSGVVRELADTKAYLRTMIEDEHRMSEDLASSFNELQSQNEELQSINEELETSKEELQSSNEELATVNEELETQLAEKGEAQIALGKSEEKYRSLIEHNPDAIVRYDRQLRHVYANPAIRELVNMQPRDILGKTPEEVNFPQDMAKDWEEKISEVFRTGNAALVDIEVGAGKTRRYFNWYLVPEFGAGKDIEYVLSTSRDITEIRNAEKALKEKNEKNEELIAANTQLSTSEGTLRNYLSELEEKDRALKNSLAEKEVLLAEIHHRVKNNLTAFIALLSLEGTYEDSPAGLALKKDLQNRARSMALIHETLYQTNNYSQVDMDLYLTRLVGEVFRSYESGLPIQTFVNAKGVTLGLPKATPIGLIINELVTNAIKHAFPNWHDCRKIRGQDCTIRVSLTKEKGTYVMAVKDNGIGIPGSIDIATTRSLGLKLVNFLAKHQMKAEISVNNNEGTEFTFRFRDEPVGRD
jgi:two-component system, chemotaxis family, CheB/CheR fusion protein